MVPYKFGKGNFT